MNIIIIIINLLWIIGLSFFFAKVEIQIEGPDGWAKNLPTWRIEKHWLLDIFWGGRALTGYHAWMFSFIALIFHTPLFFIKEFSWFYEIKIVGMIILFWIIEDFLWFVFNKSYGIKKFNRENIPWHPRWFLFLPVDYYLFGIFGITFLVIGQIYS